MASNRNQFCQHGISLEGWGRRSQSKKENLWIKWLRQRPNAPQILKYLLAGLLQKKFWWSLLQITEMDGQYFQAITMGLDLPQSLSILLSLYFKFQIPRRESLADWTWVTCLDPSQGSLADIPTIAVSNTGRHSASKWTQELLLKDGEIGARQAKTTDVQYTHSHTAALLQLRLVLQ